jgi:hypothetical protein
VTASRFDSGYVGVGGYNHFGHFLNFGEGIKRTVHATAFLAICKIPSRISAY